MTAHTTPQPMLYAVKVLNDSFIQTCLLRSHQTSASARAVSFEKPFHPPPAIFGKFKQEFPLMASMGDMPDAAWNVMSLCPSHLILNNVLFVLKKLNITPF